jgi:hypothetical protein
VNYRTTTVRQASRRSWRIGQRQPVNVYHLVYDGTVQTAALGLIARKVHSSNLFDGDLSAGGLNDMVEDESLVSLAKQLIEDAIPKQGGLEELFATREQALRASEAFIDESFVEEAAISEVPTKRLVFVGPATHETRDRLLAEDGCLRAEQLDKAKLLAAKRIEAVLAAGQLPLFSEAA